MNKTIIYSIILLMILCPHAIGTAESDMELTLGSITVSMGKAELSDLIFEDSVPGAIQDLCRVVSIIEKLNEAEGEMTIADITEMLTESGADFYLNDIDEEEYHDAMYDLSDNMSLNVIAYKPIDTDEDEFIVYIRLLISADARYKDSDKKIFYTKKIPLYDLGYVEIFDIEDALIGMK